MKKKYSLGYIPRPWQRETHNRLKRHNVLVFHRRGGKTVFCVAEILDKSFRFNKKDGNGNLLPNPQFAFIATTIGQVEKIAWSYFKYYLKDIPHVKFNEAKLRITYPHPHGLCTIFLLGGENYDSIRGIYLDGYVMDEFADMHPDVRDKVLLPTLSDRKGWEIIIGTPKGDNAFKRLYHHAQARPDRWFSMLARASDTGIIDDGELSMLRETMTEEAYRQEYECDFDAVPTNKYYQKYINKAREDGRICSVPYDPILRVHTYWDLGHADSCSIWFIQENGREIHVIEYLERHGVGLEEYVKELHSRPYVYGDHYLPHDGGHTEISTGKSRREFLEGMGLSNIRVLPRPKSVADGIHQVRMILPKCYFDVKKCGQGVEALSAYERKYDPVLKVYQDKPLHNWASHGADAFRTFAESYEPGFGSYAEGRLQYMKEESEHEYDIFSF
jgi:hypothetical protein